MRLRLNAGRPATVPTVAGLPRVREVPDEEIKRSPSADWAPNREPNVLLTCGCWIPWPVISLLGKQPGRGNHGDVWCEMHQQWLPVTEKEKARSQKGMTQWRNTQSSQSISTPTLPLSDDCPF